MTDRVRGFTTTHRGKKVKHAYTHAGRYRKKADAKKRAKNLRSAGYPARVTKAVTQGRYRGTIGYDVWVDYMQAGTYRRRK